MIFCTLCNHNEIVINIPIPVFHVTQEPFILNIGGVKLQSMEGRILFDGQKSIVTLPCLLHHQCQGNKRHSNMLPVLT